MNKNILKEKYNIDIPKNLGEIIHISDFNYSKYIFWKLFSLLFIIFCIYICINLFDDISRNRGDVGTKLFQISMFFIGFIIALIHLFSKEKILVICKKGFLLIEFIFFKKESSIKEIYYKDLEKVIVLKKSNYFRYSFVKEGNEIFSIKKDIDESIEYYKDIEALLSTYENSKT